MCKITYKLPSPKKFLSPSKMTHLISTYFKVIFPPIWHALPPTTPQCSHQCGWLQNFEEFIVKIKMIHHYLHLNTPNSEYFSHVGVSNRPSKGVQMVCTTQQAIFRMTSRVKPPLGTVVFGEINDVTSMMCYILFSINTTPPPLSRHLRSKWMPPLGGQRFVLCFAKSPLPSAMKGFV